MATPRTRFDRKLDTWTFKYDGIVGDDGEGEPRAAERTVEVEVRLCKENRESEKAPHPTKAVWFEVTCKDPELRFEGTDIEALRKAAWAELDKAFEVKWDRWFLVRVDPAMYMSRGKETGFVFSYDNVWKGTAHDGAELLREAGSWRSGSAWRISTWPGEFKDEKGAVLACIPATKQNERALESFAERVRALRGKMADFLRPEAIHQTLADLSGVPFLPGPDEGDG